MSTTITMATEIPAAPYYVLTDDSFMSDWGGAEGRVNTIILPAADRDEAEIVATNARNRDEQRNVRILDPHARALLWRGLQPHGQGKRRALVHPTHV